MGKPGRPQKRELQPEEDNISSSSDLDSQFENPVLLGPVQSKRAKAVILDSELVGPPVPAEEARRRWPLRYQSKVFTANVLCFLTSLLLFYIIIIIIIILVSFDMCKLQH